MAAPDLAALLRSVDLAREDAAPDRAPLAATWEDPPAFRRELLAFAARRTGPLRSLAGAAYDVYSDTVLRHVASDRVAFVEIRPRTSPLRLRFSELHARASSLAAAWAALGVKPGAIVALVLPAGAAGAVALAAGLHLGACLSWILPQGDRALAHALEALAPEHVVVDPRTPARVGKLAEKALPLSAPPRAPLEAPHAYGPKEPCLLSLSPLRAPFGTPVPVPAESALVRALSDAVLVHRLSPGERLCAPGLHHEQSFVPMVLSAWLAGAAFVDVPEDHFLSTPGALDADPASVLGVSPAVAAALREAPRGRPAGLLALFRDVGEPLDWLEYKEMLTRNDLGKVPFYNVLIDTAAGGTVLFGARRPGGVSAKVLPSPGAAWDLFDPATKKPAGGDVGVFVPRGGKLGEDGYFLLARTGAEHMWGGALTPRRGARVFPAEALAAEVSALPFVQGVAVVPLAGAGARGDTRFVLCVFTGGRPVEAAFQKQIATLVKERLGPDWAPDGVEMFTLYGRGKGKKTDAAWCAADYRAGRLHARAQDAAIGKLAELRRALEG